MALHRFLDLVHSEPAVPAGVPVAASGFMACPLVLQAAGGPGAAWQQQVYQWAFEQARAVVRPSLLERWQKPSAN
jgi:hypothetical protein